MKKYLLILALIIGIIPSLKAQEDNNEDPNKRQERIKALYVAYITQQLNLNADEAQRFWPIHAQFVADMKGVKHDLPELEKQQSILNIKKRYQDNFNRILGPKRCEHFFRMDSEFKNKLIERMRNKPDNPRPGGGNRRGL
ncbi:MAG: hypothetical protein NTX08_10665 [Sphingobacteriales bacterium]|nr:hypothetical protein [Sphingobacteriales bacterium]